MDEEEIRSHWDTREKEANEFWWEFVHAARRGYGVVFDPSDEMRAAINDWFKKIDDAVTKANEVGCLYFRYHSPKKNPDLMILFFTDRKDKTMRRTLKIDERFTRKRGSMDFHDRSCLMSSIANMILNEEKVKPDPRAWIPRAIMEAFSREPEKEE